MQNKGQNLAFLVIVSSRAVCPHAVASYEKICSMLITVPTPNCFSEPNSYADRITKVKCTYYL